MSTAMPIYLIAKQAPTTATSEPNASAWRANSVVRFAEGRIELHLDLAGRDLLRKVQAAGRQLDQLGLQHIQPAGKGWDEARQWALAQGYTNTASTNKISWHEAEPDAASRLQQLQEVASWTRELINLAPADMYPEVLAERVSEKLEALAPESVSTQIVKGDALLEQGWMGIHTVGRASKRPPLLAIIDYNPSGDKNAPIDTVLVGKGITFDSGGYSLKSSEGMLAMKCDMGGAATVAGALALAIQRGLQRRVQLVLCCAENLVDGSAYKLGDIITYKNGTTVEVVNTDAEGRLVLADGLLYAGEVGAQRVIDAATLTGAAQVAVGTEYNALFSVDETFAAQALQCAAQEQEAVWRLPLASFHMDACPSPFADTANSRPQKGGGTGGASNAAGFLLRFAPNQGQGWLHFDIAAAYHGSANSMWAAGATALGVRTIAACLTQGQS